MSTQHEHAPLANATSNFEAADATCQTILNQDYRNLKANHENEH
jgi:hypothetical protein